MADHTSTFIRLSLSTKAELDSLGRKGDTYETIVRRVLDDYLERHPDARHPPDARPTSR